MRKSVRTARRLLEDGRACHAVGRVGLAEGDDPGGYNRVVNSVSQAGEASEALGARQPPLERPEATLAALIPIRKKPAWWELAQDERRKIFEETSRHTTIGLGYLPAIARKLHHSRDLGEPFDFLTWFEFAPEHVSAFEELVARLRATAEWDYVDREIDIRLARSRAASVRRD